MAFSCHAVRLAALVPALIALPGWAAESTVGGEPPARPGTAEAQRQEQERQHKQRQKDADQAERQRQNDAYYDQLLQQQQQRQAADTAQGQAVLRTWQQRPPLPPDRNPLLGRWQTLGVAKGTTAKLAGPNAAGLSPELASLTHSLLGGMTAGLCDTMLGSGVVEFRPDAVLAIAPSGAQQLMYHADYRGGGSRVVVLPRERTRNFTHMIIDFADRDRGLVAVVGCRLARAGSEAAAIGTAPRATGTAAPAAAATATNTRTAAAAAPAPGSAGNAVLALTMSAPNPAGREVRVLRGSADSALIRGGLSNSPYGGLLHTFMQACQHQAPECQKGRRALDAATVGVVRIDATGHAQTPALPAGRYYVYAPWFDAQPPMVWQLPIDLHAGSNALALDKGNAYKVE